MNLISKLTISDFPSLSISAENNQQTGYYGANFHDITLNYGGKMSLEAKVT